ncbi:MAG: DUF962 domain-containing protein [Elusimicrobiota bacterium]|nr:MAG: DUF962 domain-containing protein [Elusimicrobiota bacterium]
MDYPRLVADYARYHTTPGNRRMHAIGVPLIVFAIVKWSQVGSVFPLAALVLPVYFVWDRRLGWLIGGYLAGCAAIGVFLPMWTAHAAFIIGWAVQLYGHSAYEKNSPALMDNALHLLIGPAFVAEKLAGLRR